MSGVLLTASTSTQLLTAEPERTIPTALLPGPVTSKREFTRNDTLYVLVEVDRQRTSPEAQFHRHRDDARRESGR